MKRGVVGVVLVISIVLIFSVSLISALSLSEWWNNIFNGGNNNVQLSPDNKSVIFTSPNSTTLVTQGVSVKVTWQGTGFSTNEYGYLYLFNSSGMVINPYQDYINRNMVINGWNLYPIGGSFDPTLRRDLPSGTYRFIMSSSAQPNLITSTEYGQTDLFVVGNVSSTSECISDADCPPTYGTAYCDGNLLKQSVGNFNCINGKCTSTGGGLGVTNCTNSGKVCSNSACVVNNQTITNQTNVDTCTDSDGGLNYYARGHVNDLSHGNASYDDVCLAGPGYGNVVISSPYLLEYYCGSDNYQYTNYNCAYGCSNGACLVSNQTTNNITCTDSDGGLNYYVKGSAIGLTDSGTSNHTINDGCILSANGPDNGWLREGICRGNVATWSDYNCSIEGKICSDGACILESKECIPRYYCQVSPTLCPQNGIQTKTCEDFECNTPSYSEDVQCNPGDCSGCELDGRCVPYGFRTQVTLYNNKQGTYNLYCDIDGTLQEQKNKLSNGDWEKCQNNYECYSNLCSGGECVEINDAISQAKGFKSVFFKVFCKVAHLVNVDNYNQCVANFLGTSQ